MLPHEVMSKKADNYFIGVFGPTKMDGLVLKVILLSIFFCEF